MNPSQQPFRRRGNERKTRLEEGKTHLDPIRIQLHRNVSQDDGMDDGSEEGES